MPLNLQGFLPIQNTFLETLSMSGEKKSLASVHSESFDLNLWESRNLWESNKTMPHVLGSKLPLFSYGRDGKINLIVRLYRAPL